MRQNFSLTVLQDVERREKKKEGRKEDVVESDSRGSGKKFVVDFRFRPKSWTRNRDRVCGSCARDLVDRLDKRGVENVWASLRK